MSKYRTLGIFMLEGYCESSKANKHTNKYMAKTVKPEVEEAKKSKLEETMQRMNKLYGVGSVMTLGAVDTGTYEVISTGSIGVDYLVLGIGGCAKGRMYEIRGWEGVGKSTFCGHLAANCQKIQYNGRKGKVAYIDGEHAVNRKYFEQLGVSVDDMVFCQPNTGEEGFDIAENLIKTGEIDLLIIDSDSSLIPKSIIENPIGESKIGKKASLNSTAYPKLKNALSDYKVCVIVISQYREKIGQMFGDPRTTQGGHSLKYYTDVIIDMSKSLIKTADGTEVMGNDTKVKSLKNKMFPPHREIRYEVVFAKGINRIKEVVEMATDLDIVQKSGSWFSYGNSKIGQGYEAVEQMLKDNPEMLQEIQDKVTEKVKPV